MRSLKRGHPDPDPDLDPVGLLEVPELDDTALFLSEMQLRFIAAWTGNLVAAARAAGYKHPKAAAYKLMKDPEVVKALQKKQESMLQESGENLARTLPLSRADVIDRLWQLAQLDPERTNRNISGQVKAAQTLEQIFALKIDHDNVLKRQLQDKSESELEFYVVHGFLPYQEEQKPKPVASAEAPQLLQPATEHNLPAPESDEPPASANPA